MTADDRPERDTPEQRSANVRNALLVADLKRLVRASRDNDDETVFEVREQYAGE